MTPSISMYDVILEGFLKSVSLFSIESLQFFIEIEQVLVVLQFSVVDLKY